jgi:glycosyltransferase involved in cell wall biosynthesis
MNNNFHKSIAILTQGSAVASTRFRILQNLPIITRSGFNPVVMHAKYSAYPPSPGNSRAKWFILAMYDGYRRALRANKSDICILQRELISTLFTFESLIKVPLLLDVDDAIFLGSRFHAAKRLAKRASITICGNEFLADYFSQYSKVKIIPTGVDDKHFVPLPSSKRSQMTIGWSGASSGFKYLYSIEVALNVILERNPDVILMIIADIPPNFSLINSARVTYKKWSLESEVSDLQQFTIGIMPLTDGLYERGKCSFKMLTYMAIGIPVVVSTVGMNIEVLAMGDCGYGAKTNDDWVDALQSLIRDESSARNKGRVGRAIIEENYSTDVIGEKLASIINGIG